MLHLYHKKSTFQQVRDVLESFKDYQELDISKVHEVREDAVYFVEIQNIEKNLLMHIRKLLSNKTDSLIYFFIDDSHSLMLFQLAVLLNVKSIITTKHDTTKVISFIKEDISLKKATKLNKDMVNTLSNQSSFVIFDKDEPTYASTKILHEFECKDSKELSSKLFSQIKLEPFLKDNISKDETIKLNNQTKKYNIKSITSEFTSDKYIFLRDISQTDSTKKTNIDFIKNRIYFIEVLKDKLLEKNFSDNLCSIITISIENMQSLSRFWSEYEIEMAIRDLLLQVELEIDAHTLLAQYDNKLYITLFEGLDFEATKEKANNIQAHILSYTSKKDIKPIIGLHVFDINDLDLNDALKIISDISQEEISSRDIETQRIHRIINIDSELDDQRAINMLLQATFTNKTPIKLLNIYKGLCINTASMIVKKTDFEIYVSFEQLQGTVINFEKKTVIQSPNFSKDIAADVKLIDLKKKIALLKNFKFVNGSANARKYSRVTPSQRTPISIINTKESLSGEILDISMNSIAIKTRIYKQIQELNSTQLELRFTLPIKSSEDGYMKLELRGNVTFVKCHENFCKIVIDIHEDQAHESILMEYVYARQKEIIIELKKQTILQN